MGLEGLSQYAERPPDMGFDRAERQPRVGSEFFVREPAKEGQCNHLAGHRIVQVQRLVQAGAPVELLGWVGGERKRLATRILSAEPGTGLAVFEGSGELTVAEEPRRDVAG